mgnify:CR=1 FL=1
MAAKTKENLRASRNAGGAPIIIAKNVSRKLRIQDQAVGLLQDLIWPGSHGCLNSYARDVYEKRIAKRTKYSY